MTKGLVWIAVLFLVAAGCQSRTDSSSDSSAQARSVLAPQAFSAKLLEKGKEQLIDLRTPRELSSGLIEGAKVMTYGGSAFQQQLATLDKEKPIFIYCAYGKRSRVVGNMLEEAGFKEIYDLQGGIVTWLREGYPIKK